MSMLSKFENPTSEVSETPVERDSPINQETLNREIAEMHGGNNRTLYEIGEEMKRKDEIWYVLSESGYPFASGNVRPFIEAQLMEHMYDEPCMKGMFIDSRGNRETKVISPEDLVVSIREVVAGNITIFDIPKMVASSENEQINVWQRLMADIVQNASDPREIGSRILAITGLGEALKNPKQNKQAFEAYQWIIRGIIERALSPENPLEINDSKLGEQMLGDLDSKALARILKEKNFSENQWVGTLRLAHGY